MVARIYEARTTPWATLEASVGYEASKALIHSGAAPVADGWHPPEVEVFEQVQDHRGVVPDIFAPMGYLLVSPAALLVESVRELVASTGELLPIAGFAGVGDPNGWAVYHCTTVVDVLDHERSSIRRFEDGQIMSVDSGVVRDLDEGVLPPIFRQEGVVGTLLFSEAATSAIDDAGIVGPMFTPAFSRGGPTADWDTPTTVDELLALPPTRLDDRVWLRLNQLVSFDPDALRAENASVAAYLSTRLFEWEVMNGGLHQYFFNHPSPDLLAVVLDGYTHLGLHEARRTIEDAIAPIASREAAWRDSLRDGQIETFFDSYGGSELEDLDEAIDLHDHVRVELIRAHPEDFSR